MSETEQTAPPEEKRPKDRSPSFPYIGLSKAIERTQQLFTYASRHEARIVDASKPAWGLGPKSSATLQTVAALLSFGLIEDSGSGESRRIKLSDIGYRAVADPRPGAKEQALSDVALKPKLIAEMRAKWGTKRPPEAICVGDLTIDRGFTADGATLFLRVYDDTVSYAAAQDNDKQLDSDGAKDEAIDPPVGDIAVGDLVRVEHGGQIVFEKATVRALHDHNGQPWAYLEETESAAAMSDLTLLEKAPVIPAAPPPPLPLARVAEMAAQSGEEMDRFTVDEGVVKIAFPSGMSVDSLDDLDAFFKLFIKKAKRRAGADKNPA